MAMGRSIKSKAVDGESRRNRVAVGVLPLVALLEGSG